MVTHTGPGISYLKPSYLTPMLSVNLEYQNFYNNYIPAEVLKKGS